MLATWNSSPRTWATSRPDARSSRLGSALFLTALIVLALCASCSLFAPERPPARVRPPRRAAQLPVYLVATHWPDLDGTTLNAYVIWPAEAFEANELEVLRELDSHRAAPFYEPHAR